jgi:hypothetical protein
MDRGAILEGGEEGRVSPPGEPVKGGTFRLFLFLGDAFAALSPALPAVTERFNSAQSDVDIVVEFFESE